MGPGDRRRSVLFHTCPAQPQNRSVPFFQRPPFLCAFFGFFLLRQIGRTTLTPRTPFVAPILPLPACAPWDTESRPQHPCRTSTFFLGLGGVAVVLVFFPVSFFSVLRLRIFPVGTSRILGTAPSPWSQGPQGNLPKFLCLSRCFFFNSFVWMPRIFLVGFTMSLEFLTLRRTRCRVYPRVSSVGPENIEMRGAGHLFLKHYFFCSPLLLGPDL